MSEPINVVLQLTNIHCYDEGDGIGNAEPYLWAVFYKIDGDTTFVNQQLSLQGTAQIFGTTGDHGDLGTTDVNAGDDVRVPDQFSLRTTLKPIPLQNPIQGVTEVGGAVGCIAILLEQDNTPDPAVAKGHAALNDAVQKALNDLIPTLNAVHLEPTDKEIKDMTDKIGAAVENAISSNVGLWDWLSGFGNEDDKIGSVLFKYSTSSLLDAGPVGAVMDQRWKNEGDWELTGLAFADWGNGEDLGGPPAPPVAEPVAVNTSASVADVTAGMPATAPSATAMPVAGAAIGIRPFPGGPGPVVLNQRITTAPAVASWAENRLDCFAGGSNSHIWHKWQDGGSWSGWEDLSAPPVPLVNTTTGGVMSAAVVGGAHGPIHPIPTTYRIASAPAAVSWGPNRIDTFVRGMDRALWHKWWDGSAWSSWESLGGSLGSAPAVASWQEGRLDVFVRGPSDHMWHKAWQGSWSEWEDLGGVLTSAPAAVSWAENRIDTFVRGTNNHMWHKWWDGGAWSNWEDLGGTLASAPAVSSRCEGELDCFVRGSDSFMWYKGWNSSGWSDWKIVNSGGVYDTPAAVSRNSESIDAFVSGYQGHLWRLRWG